MPRNSHGQGGQPEYPEVSYIGYLSSRASHRVSYIALHGRQRHRLGERRPPPLPLRCRSLSACCPAGVQLGYTALMLAARSGRLDWQNCLNRLITKGASLNVQDKVRRGPRAMCECGGSDEPTASPPPPLTACGLWPSPPLGRTSGRRCTSRLSTATLLVPSRSSRRGLTQASRIW